jgi:acetolactate synthase-1/2/3 large subunit
VVTTGVGQHQMFACHFLEFDEPRRLLTSSGAGTMGYGLPAAIGAATARPDATVFVVDGDGSFQMTCQELATAAQEGLRIVVLVLDNGQLGMVRQWQDREYEGRWEAVRFDDRPGHPDFALLARSFGVAGARAEDPDSLARALDEARARPGPSLVHVRIDPSADNFPMMPAGRTFAEYGGNCVPQPGRLHSEEESRAIAAAGRGVRSR